MTSPMERIKGLIGDKVSGVPDIPEKPPGFVDVVDDLEHPINPVWLVRHYIETPSTIRIFGDSGAGKSFIAVDLACQTAVTGGRWMGKRVTTGPVFYISGEGHTGLRRRLRAWKLHNKGKTIPRGMLHRSNVQMELSPAGGKVVEAEIRRIAERHNIRPVLVAIDTLARVFPPGKSENNTNDMMDFINEVDRIRDEFNCVMVIVHHTGHNEKGRPRGAYAATAAMDGELQVSRKGVHRVAKWTKLKESELDPIGQEFILKVIEVGTDLTAEDGENPMITSCCVEWIGRAPKTDASKPPTPAENVGLDTLREACAGKGYAQLEEWREKFYAQSTGEPDAKRQAFSRVRGGLQAKKRITVKDDIYTIPMHPVTG